MASQKSTKKKQLDSPTARNTASDGEAKSNRHPIEGPPATPAITIISSAIPSEFKGSTKSKPQPDTSWAFLQEFLTSWKQIWAALSIIVAIFVIVILVGEYAARRIGTNGHSVRVTFGENGATVLFDAQNKLHASFPLDSSARWVDSGIDVPAKSTVKISASGKAHLAMHHLVEAAQQDTKPFVPWVDPDGIDFTTLRDKDTHRKPFLIHSAANIGCLLACLVGSEDDQPSISNNPRPKRLYAIGKSGSVTNSEDRPLRLWFIVNDIFLTSKDLDAAEKVYKTPSSELDQIAEPEREAIKKKEEAAWQQIRSAAYWDLWWDDNIGTFWVQIEQNE